MTKMRCGHEEKWMFAQWLEIGIHCIFGCKKCGATWQWKVFEGMR